MPFVDRHSSQNKYVLRYETEILQYCIRCKWPGMTECVRERQRHNVAIAINPLLELCCLSSSRTKAIHLWNLLWILFMLLDVLFISIPYGIIWCSKHQFNSNSRYTSQLTLTFWCIVRWFAHVLTFILPFRWSIWFQSFKSDFWSKLLWFEYFRVWCWDFRGKF